MRFPDPPRGLKAIPWRAPILFFRLGLGWMFKNRALLLTHIGRVSGKPRQTVLEIVDKSADNQSFTVVSGFGSKSQWFKNISQNPNVTIQVGSRKMKARAKRLDPDQAEEVFINYIDRFPQGFRALAKMIGYQVEHTEEGYREFGRKIPIIRFSGIQGA